MELRQLQYFTVVYEEGSLTRATQRLNVVQPALSLQISKLEDELDRKLFIRTSKGMVPTEAGIEAYGLFKNVLGDICAARQKLNDSVGQVRGRVAIGVVSTVAHNSLADTLLRFHRKYPEVEVQATGGYTTELIELLRTAQLDLVIVNAAPEAKSAEMVDIIKENLVLVGAASNPLPVDAPVKFSDINGFKLVLPSQRHGLRNIMNQSASMQNFVLTPGMEIDDLKPLEELVANSDFFTVLPPLAVHRALCAGSLRAYPVTPAIRRRLVYITPKDRKLSRAASLLIRSIREAMIDFSADVSSTLNAKN